jgi:radical SAM protein with 4Fe4S-binding SPASM domain
MWTRAGAPTEKAFNTTELDDLFDQLGELGTGKITLVGTEPVMRPDLPQILADIRGRGIKPELYTAGIKLDDEIIRAILDTETDVAFSVDGFFPGSHNKIRLPDGGFDAFGRTLESIARLRLARDERDFKPDQTRISANFTVQRGNIQDLAVASAEEIDHIGVDVLRMSLVHGKGPYTLSSNTIGILRSFMERADTMDTKTDVDLSAGIRSAALGLINSVDFENNTLVPSSYLGIGKHPKCHIGEYSTMIDPQGNVRPCLYLYDDNGPFTDSSRDEYIMGNVKQQKFTEIWFGEKYLLFRQGNFPDMSPESRCRTCEYMENFKRMDKAMADPQGTLRIGW